MGLLLLVTCVSGNPSSRIVRTCLIILIPFLFLFFFQFEHVLLLGLGEMLQFQKRVAD